MPLERSGASELAHKHARGSQADEQRSEPGDGARNRLQPVGLEPDNVHGAHEEHRQPEAVEQRGAAPFSSSAAIMIMK